MHRDSQPRIRAEAGFTLVEMVITLFVTALLIAGMLTLFDTMNKIGRVQTHLADLQQNLRVAQHEMVRMTRMAGRGGLLRGSVPDGFPVEVRNNVPDSGDEAFIVEADNTSPKIEPGTDVLTIRGVFSTPLYQMSAAGPYLTLNLGGDPETGTMMVRNPNPQTGVPQDLTPLQEAAEDGIDAPILLVSPLSDIYAVVELDPAATAATIVTEDGEPVEINLNFTITGGTHTVEYQALNPDGTFPDELRTVSAVGLLEELRFYVAEPDGQDVFEPRLTMAEFLAGTEVPWGATATERGQNLRSYISDNVLDLQIAMGIDVNRDEAIDPATEWLFDEAADVDSDGNIVDAATTWNDGAANKNWPGLYFLRISTLARTDRQDFNYIDDPIETLEDRDYGEDVVPGTDENRLERRYRRRLLETNVDMRNLS